MHARKISRRSPIHTCEAARQNAYEVAKTPAFARARHERRKVEALFSELKNQIGLRRLRLRRMQVRTRAVLPGCRGTEPETTGAVPYLKAAPSEPCDLRVQQEPKAGQRKDRGVLKRLVRTEFFNSYGQ